jgi:hypothetical protein
MRMVLSWKTLLLPSGVDESVAVIGPPGAQESAIVLLLTGLPAVDGLFCQVTPLKSEGLIFSAPKNSIAPYAPFIGTETASVVEVVMERVAVSSVVAGAPEAVNVTLTWQVVGAVSVPVQELPLIAKSLFPVLAPVNVTIPVP